MQQVEQQQQVDSRSDLNRTHFVKIHSWLPMCPKHALDCETCFRWIHKARTSEECATNATIVPRFQLAHATSDETPSQPVTELGVRRSMEVRAGAVGVPGHVTSTHVRGRATPPSARCDSWSSTLRMLFLDEPLSGLDSYAAYTLVVALKDLAKANVPVLCTVHQPSSEIFAMHLGSFRWV